MTTTAAFVARSDEGTSLPTMVDGLTTIKARTADTKGSLAVLEFLHEPGAETPLHVHFREDELWYVIEGEYRCKVGREIFRLSTGGVALGPRGVPHCFQNLSETTGRMLVIWTPSGMERFFEQYAELMPGPVSPEQMDALASENWFEFLGAPLSVSDPL